LSTTLDIRNFTRRAPAPGVPFIDIASAVLPGWEISLVFAGERRAQQLNIALRGKEYVPNVLSFEAGRKSGEIIICPAVARRQAPSYGMPYKDFIAYLFIHGLLHLKGHPHGATMERHERTLLARFGFKSSSSNTNGTTHRNRH
jgi:probable rRNA maturation factor